MEQHGRTLRERLSHARRALFVGRASELDMFRRALTGPEFAVLYVHGPGGVGKSALLAMFVDYADAVGVRSVLVDGRDIAPAPASFLAGLRAALRHGDDVSALRALHTSGRIVLLVDSYEQLSPLDGWLRDRLLPDLPADALVVLAGRNQPPPAWSVDVGWKELLRVVTLGNLPPEDSLRYLTHVAVPERLHAEVLAFSQGHPLALSLVADMIRQGRTDAVTTAAHATNVVGELARRFADEAPTALHRQALRASAIARITDEGLLRAALGIEDVHAILSWLRGLSFVDDDQLGVRPHDLVRDALSADLRLRDRRALGTLRYRIGGYLGEQVTAATGRRQDHLIQDLLYLFRSQPDSKPYWDWGTLGQTFAEPVGPADVPVVVEIVRRHEGDGSAALAEHWLKAQPEAFRLCRDGAGQVRGVVGWLSLHEARPEDVAADPGTRAVWAYANDHGGLARGEQVTIARFLVDRELHQRASPTINLISAEHIRQVINRPGLRWDFMCSVHPDYWARLWTKIGYQPTPEADFDIGGLRFGVYAHDWRHPPASWHPSLVGRRGEPPAPRSDPPLSRLDFARAVKSGLRDFRRLDLLADNPLRLTRLTTRRAGGGQAGAEEVRATLDEAARLLREHPRDEKLFRAVDRTYLHPAATQEHAAEALGLPFSTYRRHLTEGVGRIVAALWRAETESPD